jgi:hypothetical protein
MIPTHFYDTGGHPVRARHQKKTLNLSIDSANHLAMRSFVSEPAELNVQLYRFAAEVTAACLSGCRISFCKRQFRISAT